MYFVNENVNWTFFYKSKASRHKHGRPICGFVPCFTYNHQKNIKRFLTIARVLDTNTSRAKYEFKIKIVKWQLLEFHAWSNHQTLIIVRTWNSRNCFLTISILNSYHLMINTLWKSWAGWQTVIYLIALAIDHCISIEIFGVIPYVHKHLATVINTASWSPLHYRQIARFFSFLEMPMRIGLPFSSDWATILW